MIQYTVWKNDKNEYIVGSYSYSYFTDSFTVNYIKEDKNIDKFSWFKISTYDNINFGEYKNIDDWFETLKECYEYVSDHGGINLSMPNRD